MKPGGGVVWEGMKSRGRPPKNTALGGKKTPSKGRKNARVIDQLVAAISTHTPVYISYAHDGPGKLQDHEKNPRKILPLNFGSDYEKCRNAPPLKYFEATCYNQNPPSTRTFATSKVIRIENEPWELNGTFSQAS